MVMEHLNQPIILQLFNSKKVKSCEIIQNQVIQQKMQFEICSAILNISFLNILNVRKKILLHKS